MTTDDRKLLLRTLDRLWGGLESAFDLCQLLVDSKDARIEKMGEAMSQAQDAILELKEAWNIERF